MKLSEMTDAQWLALLTAVPPDAHVMTTASPDLVYARRPDGTGVSVDRAGNVTEYDGNARPVNRDR